MGGIAGIVNLDGAPASHDLIKRMTDVIAHRGPDGEGSYVDGNVGLGHRRLAILDLTSGAIQPMSNPEGSVWIACNGRVFNADELKSELGRGGLAFSTRSDTEVILRAYEAWGPRCVSRFNGQFAFAIWDRRSRTLFCARDRLGIKPFFYVHGSGRFLFGSEIKQLFQDPRVPKKPNEVKIGEYLCGQHGLFDETFFEGVRRLPPGHMLSVREGRISVERYWDIDPGMKTIFASPMEYAERFRELLEDAVRVRLKSDVPIASALTGGVDSSSIVCLTAHLLKQHPETLAGWETFSVLFGNASVDEEHLIARVLESVHVKNNPIRVDAVTFFDDFDRVVWHQGEPNRDIAVMTLWHKKKFVHGRGFKVFLSGVGADDVLAGRKVYLADLLRRLELMRVWRELNGYYPFDNYGQPTTRRDLFVKFALRPLLPEWMRRVAASLDGSSVPPWIEPGFARRIHLRERLGQRAARRFGEHYHQMMYDIVTRGFNALLLHMTEMNSMAFGVENRFPFLDHRIVEYLFSIPREQKVAYGVTKIVEREAMRDLVPEAVLQNVKRPIQKLVDSWMKDVFRDWLRGAIRSIQLRDRGYLVPGEVDRLYDRYAKGRTGRKDPNRPSSLVWGAINLDRWLRINFA